MSCVFQIMSPVIVQTVQAAYTSLVATGSNVSEEDQVLGSREGNAIYSTSLHKLVLTDNTGLGQN